MEAETQTPHYRRIAEGMRNEIVRGDCAAGMKLPSTGELALRWNSSSTTVHSALMLLVKEGWIERLNGAGTYVADPGRRFVCAGIYHATEICANDCPAFSRSLHMSLLEEFRRIGKKAQIFVDTRPRSEQGTLLPTLEKAVRERRIQCLIAPTMNAECFAPLAHLKIPTAFPDNSADFHRVGPDFDDLFRKTAAQLKAQGCRSAGLIAPVNPHSFSPYLAMFYARFEAVMREERLETRSEWIVRPSARIDDHEAYGFSAFGHFWDLGEKPDGLLVYPDSAVRGVITAVLDRSAHRAEPGLKFVFHRNANIKLLCPFPAKWISTNEDMWAKWLVRSIERQFEGETVGTILMPFELGHEEGLPLPDTEPLGLQENALGESPASEDFSEVPPPGRTFNFQAEDLTKSSSEA